MPTRSILRRTPALLMTLAFLSASIPAGALPRPTRSTSERLDLKRYVAAGDRAYIIGAEDGTFPPMGWHIRGEMGGVWTHPIKALDAYWFRVAGEWLVDAHRFTSGPGYVQLDLGTRGGLTVARTEFAPDGIPAALVGLTFTNRSNARREAIVAMDVRSEIMAAYPWNWTVPSAKEFNGADRGRYRHRSGTLTFREPGKPWYAKVRASRRPLAGAIGDEYWGPVPPEERDDYLEDGNGTGGRLRWSIAVPPRRSRTLWFAVSGSHRSESAAGRALRKALRDRGALLAAKIAHRRALLRLSRVSLPDATIESGFEWGKLNMADLRRRVTDVKVRDVEEGNAYPPPTARFERLTGIGAGYPDYPWYFGTDGAYTAYPLVVSGQWGTAIEHLRTIKKVSRALNGATGKVIHEVVTDGSVYFGDADDPGNTNETAQFATAVDLVWRWTGNDRFRDEMYDFVRDGMEYITTPGCPMDDSGEGTCDNDTDGWPEGRGMVERTGMGAEKLDVTVYTWQALRALARMARSKGDLATAAWADTKADDMAARFDETWWMPDMNLYADSLCNPGDVSTGEGNVCSFPGEKLQQKHWINATPMEVALAPEDHANQALDVLESPDFTGECGLFHTGRGGGPNGAGELKCWTLPTSVMAVGEANYGRVGEDQALFYIEAIAEQLDLEMPGALPEIAPSPEYDPFVDFRERAMFMQAWSPYGIQWPIVHRFLGIDPNVPRGRLRVIPHVPPSWPGLAISDLRVGRGRLDASAAHDDDLYITRTSTIRRFRLTIGHVVPEAATVRSVRLDGRPVDYRVVDTRRGREVRVTTTANRAHTLVVIAR